MLLLITYVQYELMSIMTLIYPTHLGPIIIPDGTTTHVDSNMQIMHTRKVRLLSEVIGVKQSPVQQIFSTVEEAYLADIQNFTTNSINNTVGDVFTHLQEKYGQLMPHKLLKRKDIFKKTTYHSKYQTATIFYAAE